MFCEDIKKLMIKYFDEGLTNEENLALNEHLEVCDKCKYEFKDLEKLFFTLETENQILLERQESYLRTLNPFEVVQQKSSKKKWFVFNLNPAFSLVMVLVVAVAIFFTLSNQSNKFTSDNSFVENNLNSENQHVSDYDDYFNFYLNQDYLLDNVQVSEITKSDYFNDAINLLKEFQNQLIGNFSEDQYYISTVDYLNDKEVDEIIAQLEMKKF